MHVYLSIVYTLFNMTSWTLALYTHLPITFSTHLFWLAAEMSLIRLWTTGWEGISGYYFHAFCIIVWIGLWLASKLYLFPFAWRNHLLGKEVWFGHLFYGQQSFRVENHNSSSEIGFSGHICFCSFVWELIEIRVKPLLWALSWGQTNTYPDKVNLFNMNWLQFMMLRTQWTLGWTMNHLHNLFLLNMPHDQENLT